MSSATIAFQRWLAAEDAVHTLSLSFLDALHSSEPRLLTAHQRELAGLREEASILLGCYLEATKVELARLRPVCYSWYRNKQVCED